MPDHVEAGLTQPAGIDSVEQKGVTLYGVVPFLTLSRDHRQKQENGNEWKCFSRRWVGQIYAYHASVWVPVDLLVSVAHEGPVRSMWSV